MTTAAVPAGREFLIFAIAFGATLLGSMSGGSSSLLTTPVWLSLGVPLPTAVGTDKIAGTFWTVVGSRNYLARRPVEWRLLIGMALLGVAGALAGAAVTTSVDPGRLRRVVGGLILVAVAAVARRPHLGVTETKPRLPRALVAAAALPLGFYEGLLGSGNSIVTSLLFTTGLGFDLIRALGHYYAMAAVWCGVAAASYLARGWFDAAIAVPATLGAVAGGFLGSRLGRRAGSRVVRIIFLVAGTVLGLKLLAGW
ncbi:MAG: sulfite exporter TauE/SafE family protein [Gemmatimonadales bacterium]